MNALLELSDILLKDALVLLEFGLYLDLRYDFNEGLDLFGLFLELVVVVGNLALVDMQLLTVRGVSEVLDRDLH